MFDSMIDAQEPRNEQLRGEIKQLDKQIEEINSLESAKQNFIARMEIIEKLQRSRPEIVHVFDEIVRTLPDGVYLTGVKQTDKRFKFEGVAQSSTRVSSFMRNIDGSEWLRTRSSSGADRARTRRPGSSFTLYAEQVPDSGPGRRSAEAAASASRRQVMASRGAQQ